GGRPRPWGPRGGAGPHLRAVLPPGRRSRRRRRRGPGACDRAAPGGAAGWYARIRPAVGRRQPLRAAAPRGHPHRGLCEVLAPIARQARSFLAPAPATLRAMRAAMTRTLAGPSPAPL